MAKGYGQKSARSIARLRKRLERVPIDVRAAAATESLLQAQRLGRAMKSSAPVDLGLVRNSIRVEGGKFGDRFYVKAGGPTTTKGVRKGHDGSFDYATASEWGTEKETARPWFYPTYRAYRKSMKDGINSTIRKAAAKFNGQGDE